jgi:zinc protease
MVNLGFEQLPYNRAVLGPAAVIEQLQPEQMRAFHRGWYQPDQITAVAVGNLPVEQLIATVEQSCHQAMRDRQAETYTRHDRPHLTPETPFTTIHRTHHIDPTLQQARLMLMWRVPGLSDSSNDSYALDVLANLLSHGRTARLVQDLREQRQLVTSVSASNMSYQHQGLFCLSANLPTDNLQIVETALLEHIDRLQTDLVAQTDLEKVATQVANQFIFSNETPSARANLYGYYYALLGDLQPAFTYTDRLRALTPEDIRRTAQKYLNRQAYGAVTITPA